MKIYTKTGDTGQTSLYTGERVPKFHPHIEACGVLDECNATLGAALSFLPSSPPFDGARQQLLAVQNALFDIGASAATPLSKASEFKRAKTQLDASFALLLEQWIDQMEENLLPLTTFILPGGHPSAAFLHVARATCRRAERCISTLTAQGSADPLALILLNRLSDYLFVLCRWINHLTHTQEAQWQPQKTSP